MKQIPTAKELFDKMIEENEECTSTEMMIEFAKLHVEQALILASGKLNYNRDFCNVQKDILNSYPLENIK